MEILPYKNSNLSIKISQLAFKSNRYLLCLKGWRILFYTSTTSYYNTEFLKILNLVTQIKLFIKKVGYDGGED